MRRALILVCAIMAASQVGLLATNDTLYVEVASDTVELGDVLEIRYTMENMQGTLDAPQFEGLYPMGGPNTSTSMQMINGMTQSQQSVSYLTKVTVLGVITIPSATVRLSDGSTRETSPLEIICLPSENLDIEEHLLGDERPFMLQPRRKKTLKTRKI